MKKQQPLNYLEFIEQEAKKKNGQTYSHYINLLVEIAINAITWENLPPEIDPRYMEMTISERGHALFFRDENMEFDRQFICLPAALTGRFNIYGVPIDRRADAVNGYFWYGDDTNSVVIFNNRLRHSDIPVITYYANKLAEVERAIDVNIAGQKTPKIITCEQSNLVSLQNALKQYDGNNAAIAVTKNLMQDGSNAPITLDLTVPYKANELQIYKKQLLSEVLTYFGVENLQSEKKERQITDEIQSSRGYIELRRYARLNPRLEAAKQINEMFGLNVKPKFNNFVLYDMLTNQLMEVGADEPLYDNDTTDM